MSYILEALKKLEQKRQREETPNLLTLHGNVPQVTKKRPLWPFITAGLFLLNGVIVLLLLVGPWKNATHTPPHKPQVIARESTTPPPTSTLPEKKVELTKDMIQYAPSQPPTPVAPKVVPQPAPQKASLVQPPPQSKTLNEPTPAPTKPVQPSNKVLTIKELPADVKSKLSELKMTVHSYNEHPQSRFVVINNKTTREGQLVNGELKLEKITQNGVILDYQGHRFTLGINENP